MKNLNSKEFAKILGISPELFAKMRSAKELPEHVAERNTGNGRNCWVWPKSLVDEFAATFNMEASKKKHYRIFRKATQAQEGKASKQSIFNDFLKSNQSIKG